MLRQTLALALAAATFVAGTTFDVCPGYFFNFYQLTPVGDRSRDTSVALCSSQQVAQGGDAFYFEPFNGFLTCWKVTLPNGPGALTFRPTPNSPGLVSGLIRLVHTLRYLSGTCIKASAHRTGAARLATLPPAAECYVVTTETAGGCPNGGIYGPDGTCVTSCPTG